MSAEVAAHKTEKIPFLRFGGFKRIPVLLALARRWIQGFNRNLEMEHIRMANELYPKQKSKPVARERVTRAMGNGAYGGAPTLEQERNVHSELATTRVEANPTPKKSPAPGVERERRAQQK